VALLHSGGVSDICVVRNVSPNGLSVRVYRKLFPGNEVEIEFRSGELLKGSVVWEDEYDLGIVFPRPIDVTQVLASRWSTQAEKRRALPRIALDCAGWLSNGLRSVEVMLRDISQGGQAWRAGLTPPALARSSCRSPICRPLTVWFAGSPAQISEYRSMNASPSTRSRAGSRLGGKALGAFRTDPSQRYEAGGPERALNPFARCCRQD